MDRKLREARAEVNEFQLYLNAVERTIKDKENYRERMIAEYKHIKSVTFDEHAVDCPTCGQAMPTDQINQAREKFNVDKSKRLEENINNVKMLTLRKKSGLVITQDYSFSYIRQRHAEIRKIIDFLDEYEAKKIEKQGKMN